MSVMEMAIRTEGLSKRFGAVQALAGLDLEVRAGEVFGYLGPNGAGPFVPAARYTRPASPAWYPPASRPAGRCAAP